MINSEISNDILAIYNDWREKKFNLNEINKHTNLDKNCLYIIPHRKYPHDYSIICSFGLCLFAYLSLYTLIITFPADFFIYLSFFIILSIGAIFCFYSLIKDLILIKQGVLIFCSKGLLFLIQIKKLEFISWSEIKNIEKYEIITSDPDGGMIIQSVRIKLNDERSYYFDWFEFSRKYSKSYDFFYSLFINYFNRFSDKSL
ncbi:MAG: hypothetical protein ACP6IY_13815 [Promethearchaeia archaeon]